MSQIKELTMNQFWQSLFSLAFVLISFPSVARAASGELQFDGNVYTLGWKLTNPHEVKNEYVRSSETVQNWQRLITVQQFPENQDPAAFAKAVFHLAKQQEPGETPEAFQKQGQYMLCYFLHDTKLGKTEFIFQRVCKEPEVKGLKVYTFSIHTDSPVPPDRVEEIKSKKLGWLTELSHLHIGLVE
jgi:hypothetical protein